MKLNMNAATRATIYTVSLAVLGLLVGYSIVESDKVALWQALLAAVLTIPAPVTALTHLTPDPKPDEDDR